MRPVLQVCADRGIAPGSTKGAALHLGGVARGLSRAGCPVVAFTARRPEGPFPVEVRPLAELALSGDGPEGAVIYERYSLGHREGLERARSLGVPFVLEVNAPLVAEATIHRPHTVCAEHRRVEAELLAEADLVITVSSALRSWAQGLRSGRPTVTIPNGFEPTWFPAPPRPVAIVADRRRLVFLGHPKPWHGADRLPDLLVALAGRGHRPELLVIGGGPGAEALMASAAARGMSDQIVVTGPVSPETVPALLATADVGLAPYRRQEPFYFCPLKVIDYLAAGLAVVATDQGDIGQLVAGDGIVVAEAGPQPGEEALASAVASLLDDPGRAQRLGASGRRRALATLTWDHVARRTLAAIEALT